MASLEQSALIAAFTEEQVSRLTGVSLRQLRYWASTSFYVPGLKYDGAEKSRLRLYNFRDLVCLKVLNALRNDARIPLQELRAAKDRLAHLGDDMWAKTTLYVRGKKVVFDNPEIEEREEASSGQGVLQIPLRVVSGNMEESVLAMQQRKGDSIGRIVQKRSVAQNQPVLAGTRIPVRSIQAFAKAGYSVAEINRQYPTLEQADIKAAINFKAAQ